LTSSNGTFFQLSKWHKKIDNRKGSTHFVGWEDSELTYDYLYG
jgi:hypothetical protein